MTRTDTIASADERRALDDVRNRLITQFPDAGHDVVDTAIGDAHRRFDGGRIRDFVPLFVERAAREQLAANPVHIQ